MSRPSMTMDPASWCKNLKNDSASASRRQRMPVDKSNHTHCSFRCRFVRKYRSSLSARSRTTRREGQAPADTDISEEITID